MLHRGRFTLAYKYKKSFEEVAGGPDHAHTFPLLILSNVTEKRTGKRPVSRGISR